MLHSLCPRVEQEQDSQPKSYSHCRQPDLDFCLSHCIGLKLLHLVDEDIAR